MKVFQVHPEKKSSKFLNIWKWQNVVNIYLILNVFLDKAVKKNFINFFVSL